MMIYFEPLLSWLCEGRLLNIQKARCVRCSDVVCAREPTGHIGLTGEPAKSGT